MNASSSQNPSQALPPKPRRRRTITERLLNNFSQKFVALVGSLTLFFVVLSDRNMSMTFDEIPVVLRIPEGYALRNGDPTPTVNVKVQGRASRLKQISRDDLGTLSISPPAREGLIQVTLHPNMLSVPEGVRIERFYPEFVGVNLEPIARRIVAISTDHALSGKLAPGYLLGEVRIYPPELEIMGPKSWVEETSQLYIEPIDLTGKVSTFTVNRWVIFNRVGLQTTGSPQVEVTVSIVQNAKQYSVLGVPIVSINLNYDHEFIPSTVDLTLIGNEASLAKIEPSKIFITVDAGLDQARPAHARLIERHELRIQNLPEGVGLDETRLPSILLKVSADGVPRAVRGVSLPDAGTVPGHDE